MTLYCARQRIPLVTPPAIGALLGTQKGREVSIVNSFELVVVALTPSTGGAGGGGDSADVDMEQAESTTGGGGGEPMTTNAEAGPSSSSSSGSISTRAGGLRGKSSAPAARNQISEEFLERRRQQCESPGRWRFRPEVMKIVLTRCTHSTFCVANSPRRQTRRRFRRWSWSVGTRQAMRPT